jgi:hypothetical protein
VYELDGTSITFGAVRSMVIVDESRVDAGPVLPAASVTLDADSRSVSVPSPEHVVLTVYSAPLPVMPETEHDAVPAPETTVTSDAMRLETASSNTRSNEGVRLFVGLDGDVQLAVGAVPSMV